MKIGSPNRQCKRRISACYWCGADFLADVTELKRGKGLYCCKSCASSAAAKQSSAFQWGDNNPNWKGGISKDHYRYKRLYMQRFPIKAKAQKQAYSRRRRGKLVPQPCEACGATEKIEMHHEDYSKPFDVRWFCWACHRRLHLMRATRQPQ